MQDLSVEIPIRRGRRRRGTKYQPQPPQSSDLDTYLACPSRRSSHSTAPSGPFTPQRLPTADHDAGMGTELTSRSRAPHLAVNLKRHCRRRRRHRSRLVRRMVARNLIHTSMPAYDGNNLGGGSLKTTSETAVERYRRSGAIYIYMYGHAWEIQRVPAAASIYRKPDQGRGSEAS